MFSNVFLCLFLFVFVPGTCRIRCLLSYASNEKNALNSQFIVRVNELTTSARFYTDTHFYSDARRQIICLVEDKSYYS